MPQGSKAKYTNKQKRKAEHIEEGYEERGVKKNEAERRAWATVNKESGGGKKSGSGRGKKTSKGRRARAAASVARPRPAARKRPILCKSARKAAATRRKRA